LANGSSTVVWDGNNDNSGSVGGGMYTIKAEIVDPFGQVTSLVQSVQVLPGGSQQSLDIFNSAGELVRTIRLPVPVPGATACAWMTAATPCKSTPARAPPPRT